MELRQFFFKTLIFLGTLVGLYVLFQVRGILLIFFGAILFASTVRPAVLFLSARRIPPILSILAIYLAFLAGLIGLVAVLFPTLFVSIQNLVSSQADVFSALELAMRRLEALTASNVGLHFPIVTAADMQKEVILLQGDLQLHIQSYLLDSFRVLSEAVILFVMAFYWLTERDRFEDIGQHMIPLRHRERFISIINEIETTMGAFVRGQTILCGTVGFLAFIVLSIVGIRSALVLAAIAAVTEAIPMLGPILGAIPAILVALLDSPEKALFVGIGYLIIQQFEAHILVPKVMERQVGLSPLFVLLALTAGNLLAGIVGALIAIPIAAALKILVRELVVAPTVQANQMPVVGGAVLLTEAANEEALNNTEEEPATPPTPTILLPK